MSISKHKLSAAFMAIDVQRMFCDAAYDQPEAEAVAKRIAHVKPLFNILGVPSYLFKANSIALKIPPETLELHLLNPNKADHVIEKKPDHNSILADEDFAEALREEGYDHLYITGFNTAYCVLSSVLDARNQGYKVTVLTDCIGAVRSHTPVENAHAMKAMRKSGARFATSQDILSKLECI